MAEGGLGTFYLYILRVGIVVGIDTGADIGISAGMLTKAVYKYQLEVVISK